MSKKRIKWTDDALTLEKAFDAFILSQMAKGVKEKTAKNYRCHFKAMSKHIDVTMTFEELLFSLSGLPISFKTWRSAQIILSYLPSIKRLLR